MLPAVNLGQTIAKHGFYNKVEICIQMLYNKIS